MTANVQTQKDYQIVNFPAQPSRPALYEIDDATKKEYARVVKSLEYLEMRAKSLYSHIAVSYTKKGKLAHQPLYAFFHKGLPFMFTGIDAMDKIQAVQIKLAAYQRWEAVVSLFAEQKIYQWVDCTEARIAEKQAEIQRLVAQGFLK